MTSVIFIEARAGSTRLPKKHLLLIDGYPVIRHVMDAAKGSSLAADVVVSTNCPDIQQIAVEAGVEFYDRDDRLCQEEDDLDGQNEKIVEWNSLQWRSRNGQVEDFVSVRLMGCCLIMKPKLIDETIMAMEGGAARARTMFKADQEHPFYACYIDKDGVARYDEDDMPIRSEEMPDRYIVDGGPLAERVSGGVANSFVPVVSQKGDVMEIHDSNSFALAKGLWESRYAMQV